MAQVVQPMTNNDELLNNFLHVLLELRLCKQSIIKLVWWFSIQGILGRQFVSFVSSSTQKVVTFPRSAGHYRLCVSKTQDLHKTPSWRGPIRSLGAKNFTLTLWS